MGNQAQEIQTSSTKNTILTWIQNNPILPYRVIYMWIIIFQYPVKIEKQNQTGLSIPNLKFNLWKKKKSIK